MRKQKMVHKNSDCHPPAVFMSSIFKPTYLDESNRGPPSAASLRLLEQRLLARATLRLDAVVTHKPEEASTLEEASDASDDESEQPGSNVIRGWEQYFTSTHHIINPLKSRRRNAGLMENAYHLVLTEQDDEEPVDSSDGLTCFSWAMGHCEKNEEECQNFHTHQGTKGIHQFGLHRPMAWTLRQTLVESQSYDMSRIHRGIDSTGIRSQYVPTVQGAMAIAC